MPVVLSSFSIVPSCHVNQFKVNALSEPNFTSLPCNTPRKLCLTNKSITMVHKNKSPRTLKFIPAKCTYSSTEFFGEESGVENDWMDQDQEETEDMDSPWEGAVVYQRNPSILHLEYCTTLERLGLGKHSTDVSKSRASLMGLRVTKAVKDFPLGTPVLISIDVTRRKRKLRLDGIIRTVITLGCSRCGGPAAESVYSNFSLLLTEDPIEEHEIIDMGVIFGEDKFRTSTSSEEDDDSIDFEDRLHFPPEEKLIDISKHIRDTVHLEIVITAVCDPTCKGLCLKCGTNLNTGNCDCSKQKVKKKGYGSLGGLREQMQQKIDVE